MNRDTCEHFAPIGISCQKCSTRDRQARLKKKRLNAGLVRVEIYATPEHKQKILEFAASLKT